MLTENEQSAASARRMERASAAAAPAVWDLDLATGAFAASARLNELLGLSNAAPVGLVDFVNATHPADRAWVQDLEQPDGHDAVIGQVRSFHFRIVRGDGEVRWVSMKVDIAYARAEHGTAPASYTGVVEDITDERDAAHALIESEERFKLAVEAGRMAVWEVDLDAGALTQSLELNMLLGFPPEKYVTLADVRALYAPGEMERINRAGVNWEVIKARAVRGESPSVKAADGAPEPDRMQIQTDIAIITPDGARKDLLLRAQHARSLRGEGERVTGLLIDITERKRSEERLAVVARELQHRVKNSLAVVQTLAVQSFRGQADNEAATQAFLGRLRALAVATGMIIEADGAAAALGDVVQSITRPYRMGGTDAFIVAGDAVELRGSAATGVGMALHELCTNAVKYGALSATGGRVSLSWRVEDGHLTLDWIEEGGPAVLVPVRRGFGSRLLETVLASEQGDVDMAFEPYGLRCRLSLALR
jgi:two-component sensor histidine kinase